MVMQAYSPALYKNLGVFVPLIVVNCVILGRAEAFANKNKVLPSIMDALGMGVGFTLGLVLIAIVREILGVGTITIFPIGSFDGVIPIPGLINSPVRVVGLAAGALLVMGYLKALIDWHMDRK
jgi:electron transport complex protein RnfE